MIKKVKIIGAGSIGNHLSHASRQMGWDVDLCDIDSAALERTRNQIYPARYGAWDNAIRLFTSDNAPTEGYDLICIGTPPDVHIPLAVKALGENPKALLIEKPLCRPDLKQMAELAADAAKSKTQVFVGYDHAVGGASSYMIAELPDLGTLETLDVEFREYWGGIFAAHPWLSGPSETYLGYWRRGGGASGEHSHAIHLWQHFARSAGAGKVIEVSAELKYVRDGVVDYDAICALSLRTEEGMVGRVIQDVITRPTRKWARLQGQNGALEWFGNQKGNDDMVIRHRIGSDAETTWFHKTRPDDFVRELKHIQAQLQGSGISPMISPISLESGLDTMMVVAAAHRSATERRVVLIDYAKGYTEAALHS